MKLAVQKIILGGQILYRNPEKRRHTFFLESSFGTMIKPVPA